MILELRFEKARGDLKRAMNRGDKGEIKRARREVHELWVELMAAGPAVRRRGREGAGGRSGARDFWSVLRFW